MFITQLETKREKFLDLQTKLALSLKIDSVKSLIDFEVRGRKKMQIPKAVW